MSGAATPIAKRIVGCKLHFDVWEVVKIPFPYTNRPVEQYRPAVVVGLYEADEAPVLLWVLMVTSASHRRWLGDVEISDLQLAGLPAPSLIRTSKIATIEGAQAQKIGHLAHPDQAAVRERLCKVLRLDAQTNEV